MHGHINGIQICRGEPSVSYLLFDDNCFLFCKANLTKVRYLTKLLNTYTDASCQEINLIESEVFLSRNMTKPVQEDMACIIGVRHMLGTWKYLGFPSMIGRSKKATFSFIKDYILKTINSWRGGSLLKAWKKL